MSLAFSTPAWAQNAADRVDPGRADERAPEDQFREPPQAVLPPVVQPAADALTGDTFAVGAIDIVGLKAMSRASFADILEDYVGRSLSAEQLGELADRLAARARKQFPLASATIEPQTLRAGILRVTIDEGAIDEVRLDGPQNGGVLAALRPLATGEPVSTAQLERRLLIAGDIDGVALGEARVLQEDGRNILLVKLAYREFRAEITFDNDSTDPVGPLEAFGSARFNGVLGEDDSLQLFALNAIPEVAELSYARARYNNRISPAGTEVLVTGSYSHSAPGAYLGPLDIAGESWLGSLGLLHPLARTRGTSLWLQGELSHRQVRRDRADALVREDRLTVLRATISGYTAFAGGRLWANASVAQGLDLLGANQPGDPLSSRSDADGTFTTAIFSASWTRDLIAGFGVRLAVRSQIASQALLLSEEIGLGGATFGRGYDYSERSGDQGTMAYGELTYGWDQKLGPIDGLEVYAFADGGEVTNFGRGFGSGSLFSSGGGVRADVDRRTDAAVEVAVPLSGPRYDSDSEDPRIRFSVTRHF